MDNAPIVGGGGSAFSRKPLPPTPMDNIPPNPRVGGGTNHAPQHWPNQTAAPNYSGHHGVVSNEHHRKANPHISSYTQHNPPGNEPSVPVSAIPTIGDAPS